MPSYALPTCDTTTIQALAPKKVTINLATELIIGSTDLCLAGGQITTNKAKAEFIDFEVALPATWNNRMVFIGNSLFGGSLPSPNDKDFSDALAQNFAVVATDTGHESVADDETAWALNNTLLVKDFEFLAVHKALPIAQTIINAYYSSTGFTILFSYFEGCSTGGRQALVEAEKYPTDFDGVIAGGPAIGDLYLGLNSNEHAILSPGGFLTPDAIHTVDQAVANECGENDGITNAGRLVLNPAACTFETDGTLTGLQCPGSPASGCLTAGEITSFTAIYDGPKDTEGNQIYPGYSVSDPDDTNSDDPGWSQITGCSKFNLPCPTFNAKIQEPWGTQTDGTALGPVQWIAQDGFLRDFVFSDPSYFPLTFNFLDQKSINKVNSKVVRWGSDGMEFKKLKTFVKKNHKLLIYHGWSDPVLSPFQSVNFFTSAQAQFGASTTDNIRLFMVPGMHHCQGGPGPNFFDVLTPLTQWVESGTAPDSIIATHFPNNDDTQNPDRTLPLCSYPEVPHFNGGDPTVAANWTCQ